MEMLVLALVVAVMGQEVVPTEPTAHRQNDLTGPRFILDLEPVFVGRKMTLGAYRSRHHPSVDILRRETMGEGGGIAVAWARSDTCAAVTTFLRDGPSRLEISLPILPSSLPPAPVADGVRVSFQAPFGAIEGASTRFHFVGNIDSPVYAWWTRHEAALERCWVVGERP
ncbi:MAG: hypothetical protein EON91_13285 [Brevundimonas sp.]|uniref:hypothetical protein n=1 Tax=Brevundimonas sp. TaxID=1871086 RepID=UPI00120B2484|nr:hypothetical protein [Brevundimonas sp.]RZJ16438.1 MAG: hypothetical protein EON91_13285 [Brevundimonas sp.]